MFRAAGVIFIAFLVAACGALRGEIGLRDAGAVQTPVYSANKVLFLQGSDQPDGRVGRLREGYELASQVQRGEPAGTRRAVHNRQPLSIVISRAYLPANIAQCNRRASDLIFHGGRDIAVLLDVSASAATPDFIAVWYQRDVPPDDLLVFQDLLVFSNDAWDARYPPYFRLRLVDVSAERNTAVGALLDRVRSSSSAITSTIGLPEAAPIIGIAALAARQVLAHEHNKALVDFTFQLYGEHLLAEAGGVPLGVLQTGGMILSAPPCGAGNQFWANELSYDHRLDRIVDSHNAVQSMPFVFATVLTADLAVPQIVRDRSTAIMNRLTNPQVALEEIQQAQSDATRLMESLGALNLREQFRHQPTKDSFGHLVSEAATNWDARDVVEKSFFLNVFNNVAGRSLSSPADYLTWLRNCSGNSHFDENAGRFVRDPAINGADGQSCWPPQ
jgi:hypothetical protein